MNEAAASDVSLAGPAQKDEWDGYVASKPDVPPFAAFGWGEVLQTCYGAEPLRLAARRSGRICGALFGYRHGADSRMLYSPPFGLVADDPAAIRALLDAARDFAREHGVVRTIISSGERSTPTPYHAWTKTTLVKQLSDNEDEVWKGLRKKSRYTIRHAAQHGIEVRQGFEYLHGFYAAYESRMAEKCLPLHSLEFFEQMSAALRHRATLFVAALEGRILGGMIFVLGRDVAAYQYNAAYSDALPLGVNHLVMWEAMRDFIARGIRRVDLGESSPGGGVHEFKTLQFGAEPQPVFYYDVMRQPGAAAPEPPMPLTYKLTNRLVPLLPARLRRSWLLANKRFERLL